MAALRTHGFSNGGRRLLRLSAAIKRRDHGAKAGFGRVRERVGEGGFCQHLGDNAVFRCSLAPAFEVGGFLRGVDGKGDAGADEADVATGALVHAVPQIQRVHHQRQLAFVAITGPDPAPVPARLFVPDTTLLAECDAQALIDQFERRRGAHDPAADNDNVDLCR